MTSLAKFIAVLNKEIGETPEAERPAGMTVFPENPDDLTVFQAQHIMDILMINSLMSGLWPETDEYNERRALLEGAIDDMRVLAERKAAAEQAAEDVSKLPA